MSVTYGLTDEHDETIRVPCLRFWPGNLKRLKYILGYFALPAPRRETGRCDTRALYRRYVAKRKRPSPGGTDAREPLHNYRLYQPVVGKDDCLEIALRTERWECIRSGTLYM
ncbi:hypothetical protein EVAR_2426_1 [Eumeta japonica]|uniref:Uncharacterized protein n=1 Tax=Eumeta variegata TaxID=151549 RepID=A0A4C1SR58_EUMVA|nr:hypothetical protein EVAR_2426_1 [Eumeta japonica]